MKRSKEAYLSKIQLKINSIRTEYEKYLSDPTISLVKKQFIVANAMPCLLSLDGKWVTFVYPNGIIKIKTMARLEEMTLFSTAGMFLSLFRGKNSFIDPLPKPPKKEKSLKIKKPQKQYTGSLWHDSRSKPQDAWNRLSRQYEQFTEEAIAFVQKANTWLATYQPSKAGGKEKYQKAIDSIDIPRLIGITNVDTQWRGIFIYSDGYMVNPAIGALGISRERTHITTIGAIRSLMLGIKQRHVRAVAEIRRNEDGTYKGSEKSHATKVKNNSYGETAAKIAKLRRNEDGTYRGADKTALKRRENGKRSGKLSLYTKKTGEKIVMRSSWEWCFAYLLDLRGLNWRYEPIAIPWKGHFKIPDFEIEGYGLFEIKPKYYLTEVDLEFSKEYAVTIVTEDNIDWDFLKYKDLAKECEYDKSSEKDASVNNTHLRLINGTKS